MGCTRLKRGLLIEGETRSFCSTRGVYLIVQRVRGASGKISFSHTYPKWCIGEYTRLNSVPNALFMSFAYNPDDICVCLVYASFTEWKCSSNGNVFSIREQTFPLSIHFYKI